MLELLKGAPCIYMEYVIPVLSYNLALQISSPCFDLSLTFLFAIYWSIFLTYNSSSLFPVSSPHCTQVMFIWFAAFQVTSFFELFWLHF